MSCKPTYKGVRYGSLEELYKANNAIKPGSKEDIQKAKEFVKSKKYGKSFTNQEINDSDEFIKEYGINTNVDQNDFKCNT